MKGRRLLVVLLLAALVAPVAGCGAGKPATRLLPSEQKLKGMYEACQNIKLNEQGAATRTISTRELPGLGTIEISAVLVRSNGMTKTDKWSGVRFSDVLGHFGVVSPFKELRIEGWDGYVGRVSSEIALRPDTILADTRNGKPLPREDGPVRLVVGSEDGFYWIRMITIIEVIR